MYVLRPVRCSSDDWDPQRLSDDQTTEDLAALGMHTTAAPDDDMKMKR